MRKRRRNITIINNEIDYDKLAKAIVKAQQTAKEQQTEEKPPKLSFRDTLKLIVCVIFNKAEFNGTVTSAFLGGMMSMIFNIIAILGLIVLIFWFIVGIMAFKHIKWSFDIIPANIITITMFICCEIIVATISFVFRCIANEIEKEKDRNYIVAVFSGIVSFAALVVALIALLKEVG